MAHLMKFLSLWKRTLWMLSHTLRGGIRHKADVCALWSGAAIAIQGWQVHLVTPSRSKVISC